MQVRVQVQRHGLSARHCIGVKDLFRGSFSDDVGLYSLLSIYFFDFSLLIRVSNLRFRTFATYSYQDAARELDMDG